MPEIWMDVDTALAEVPVNVMPLLDDTDFKTVEDAIAYNATGMDLRWNFVTTAGAYTSTAVTPTTAGDYDWTHQGDGMYSIEIPASGGASINNDTEGFGWFSGKATGVLPWRGPVIGFRAAGLNNLLIDDAYSATRGMAGTALPDAAADAAGGLPISDAGGLDLDTQLGKLVGTIATGTHNPQSGDAYARLGAPAGASVSDDVAAVKVDTAAILDDTGTSGVVVAAASKTGYTLTPTTGLGNQTANITGNLSGSVGSVTGSVGGNVTGSVGSISGVTFPTNFGDLAITVTTGKVTVGTNDDKTGYSLTAVTGLGNQTADITGNLSGSVGSVTGAVGSVTGAVGSVTGNVGGNVTGSVGSVLGGINTAAGTIQTLDALDTAQDSQHATTQAAIADVPTVAEFEARTLAAAAYFDPATDGVTLANGVAHGGSTATLELGSSSGSALTVASSHASAPSVRFKASGSGNTAFTCDSDNSYGMHAIGLTVGGLYQASLSGSGTGLLCVAGGTLVPITGAGFECVSVIGSDIRGDVTGNVGGNVTGSVGSVAAGGITAASIATDAIDADALAADAVAEIQSGLSTIDAAGVRTAVGLAAANLDTQLAAIVADTNELQTDWADGGRLDLILDATSTLTASQVNAEVLDVLNVDTLVAGVTIAEAVRRIGTITSGKVTGAGLGTETFTDWADSANTIVVTVDASGNRSGITYN